MELTMDATLFALLAGIQLLGAVGLIASRLGEKWGRLGACQLFFFTTMLLVASATIISLMLDSSAWAVSGTTLSLMVVGGTLDCGRWERFRAGG
jgi:hypothetical protein